MYYFLAIVYTLSFWFSFHIRFDLYRRMEWDRYSFRRPYNYSGSRFADTLRILIVSLVPLLNSINAIEMLSRRDEYGKMVAEAREWREKQAHRDTAS